MAITFGNESAFLTAGTFYISVAKLTPSSCIVAYRDNTDGHGEAIVGTISGITTTFHTLAEFLSADGVIYNYVAALDSSKFVIVYTDTSDSDHGTAKIGTISGTTITFGNETEFLAADGAGYNSIAILDASGFVVAYRDEADSNHGTTKVGTVSGTTITFGNEAEFLAADGAYFTSITMLNENKFIVAYRDQDDSGHGTAKIGTVNGTTITFGAESEFNSDGVADSISITSLSSTKFIVAYWDGADFNHGTAKIGTVSGTTITFGAETEFLSGTGSDHICVITLNESTFIVLYYDTTDSGHGTAKIGTINGTTITFSEETEFESGGAADYISATALDSSKFVVAYRDISNNNWGTIRIGTIPTSVSASDDLFIRGYDNIIASGDLVIPGHKNIITSGDLFTIGPQQLIDSDNLFIHGYDYIIASGNLFIEGLVNTSGWTPSLFICGHDVIQASGDLFIQGHDHIVDSGSIGLFIFGIEPLVQSIDWLLKSSDHYPQIIGTLEGATSVTIQLWEVTDGQNILVSLVSSDCYQIGNTGRWAWSTVNLPTYTTYQRQYFYIMTANHNNTFAGQFFLEVPERAKWIHPNNRDDYIL